MVTPAQDIDAMSHILDGLEHLSQGVTIFDQNLRMVAWNSKFLQIYGYPAEMAYPGADFASFIAFNAARGAYGPGDPAAEVLKRVTMARKFRPHRFQRRLLDGSMVEIDGKPLPNGGFVTTYTDITESVQQRETLRAEVARTSAELRLSEERLGLIADEVPAGIAHIDQGMNILYANMRFARAYGRTPAEITGLNTSEVLHPRTLTESRKFFEQSRRGALVDFEMQIELPGARFKHIRTLLRPERPSSGEVIGFYLVSIDVTRRKATMGALMRSQKMDALGRMASGISHDFNNLLTIILGNLVPMAEQLGEREEVETYLRPSIAAARRGSSLTRRLVGLARREQVDPEPTDIREAIEEICTLLVSSLPASVELVRTQSSDLPDALVDRAQLEMALLNLALNARDATGGRGRLEITTARYTLQPDEAELFHMPAGEYVRIDFSDDGCGMSPEMSERIFEPFVTSKAAGAGSGLGLSMVYGFVRQSNGAIWVETEPGAGATFTILLPSVDLAPPAAALDPAAVPEPAPAPVPSRPATPAETLAPAAEIGEASPPRPALVLLVEDDREVRRIIRRKIARLGHHLVEAGGADEALNLLAQVEGIDLLISDIDMPGAMDGLELAARLREIRTDLPVILMSGNARFASPTGRPAGLPFLGKPFTLEALRLAIEAAMPEQRERTAP